MGTVTVANAVAALIRAKYAAIVLGPAGVGYLSQANSLFFFANNVGALAMGAGLMKYVADSHDDHEVKTTICSAFSMQVITASLVMLALLVFARPISGYFFSTDKLIGSVIVLAIGLPFVIATNGLMVPTLYGLNSYRLYAKAAIMAAVFNILPFVLLIHFYQVKGAFVQISVSAAVTFLLTLFYMRRIAPMGWLNWKFVCREKIKDLLSYGSASFGVTMLYTGTALLTKAVIIQRLGVVANGFYHIPVALHALYVPIFQHGLWAHTYPILSANPKKQVRDDEINKSFRFCFLMITPLLVAMILGRSLIIKVVYTSSFLPASDLVAVQFFGDFFFISTYIVSLVLLATARLKWFLGLAIIYNLIFVGSLYGLIGKIGVLGAVWGHVLGNVVILVVGLWALHKKLDFRPSREVRRLFVICLSVVGVVALLGA
ncbi:hypothetical protein LCGC14_0517160 [marine sediment metagenome]|uniref:Uncharacterized protein n=1 Tax=marine sediment metagenome TaxID=412755 RepID=A0A0F9SI35_9ZZZZ